MRAVLGRRRAPHKPHQACISPPWTTKLASLDHTKRRGEPNPWFPNPRQMKPSTLKGRLAAARYAHDVTMDQYNRLPVPSLEELCAALRDNRWLCALVETARLQRDLSNDGGVCATPETFHDKYATGLAYDALVAVVPFLRRLGYSVMLFSDRNREHPFNVGYPWSDAPPPQYARSRPLRPRGAGRALRRLPPRHGARAG